MAPTFVFNSVSLTSLSASNTYYAQMVTTTPGANSVTVSDINSLLISTPQTLTGTTYSGGNFGFADQTFNTRTYPSSHVGFIVAWQLGGTPSSSDPLIAFSPHTNSFGQEIILPIGTYAILLDFGPSGLFSVVNAWQYVIGPYVDNNSAIYNNGGIQLIGTVNNTVAYSNPSLTTPPRVEILTGGTLSTIQQVFNRAAPTALSNAINNHAFMFRFKSGGDIRFDTGARVGWNGSTSNAARTFLIHGSNNLAQGWGVSALNDLSNWTLLIDLGVRANLTGPAGLSSAFNSAGTFYKFIRVGLATFNGAGDYFMSNIDFYGCTFRTPNQNFA